MPLISFSNPDDCCLSPAWQRGEFHAAPEKFPRRSSHIERTRLHIAARPRYGACGCSLGTDVDKSRSPFPGGAEKGNEYRCERAYGSFYRAVPLPKGAKFEDVKATFTDGVLEVIVPLPVKTEAGVRRVEVKGPPAAAKSAA